MTRKIQTILALLFALCTLNVTTGCGMPPESDELGKSQQNLFLSRTFAERIEKEKQERKGTDPTVQGRTCYTRGGDVLECASQSCRGECYNVATKAEVDCGGHANGKPHSCYVNRQ